MFIYLIVNHETGKYYVGQHKGSNLKKYLQQKFHHAQGRISSNSRLYNSMRAHPDLKVWSIHALCSDIQTREELNGTERDFIKFLRSQEPEYGYNICRGGEGFTGPHSPESRAKTTQSLKRLWLNPKTHDKMAKGLRKGWSDPKTRQNLAEANRVRLSNPTEHAKAVEAAKRLHTPEIQAKSAKARESIWDRPGMRAKAAKAGKRGWSGKNRAKTLKAVRNTNSSPEYRANMVRVKSRILAIATLE